MQTGQWEIHQLKIRLDSRKSAIFILLHYFLLNHTLMTIQLYKRYYKTTNQEK